MHTNIDKNACEHMLAYAQYNAVQYILKTINYEKTIGSNY